MNSSTPTDDLLEFITVLVEKPAMVAGPPLAAHGMALALAAMLISRKNSQPFAAALTSAVRELKHITGDGATHRNYVPPLSADGPEVDSPQSYEAFTKNARELFRRVHDV